MRTWHRKTFIPKSSQTGNRTSGLSASSCTRCWPAGVHSKWRKPKTPLPGKWRLKAIPFRRFQRCVPKCRRRWKRSRFMRWPAIRHLATGTLGTWRRTCGRCSRHAPARKAPGCFGMKVPPALRNLQPRSRYAAMPKAYFHFVAARRFPCRVQTRRVSLFPASLPAWPT